jgi:type VI secretion system protein ImpG
VDRRLLSYYDRELGYLRELGAEFAEEFPKVAGQLGLTTADSVDPHVERLLEGFAFLAARVQLGLDSEFPRFTEHLLDMIYPHCLAPTPSMAMVCFEPNARQLISSQGFTVPRGTVLRTEVADRKGAVCRFRSGHDVTLWPIELTKLEHSSFNSQLDGSPFASAGLAALEREGRSPRGLLRLGLRSLDGRPLSELTLDRLPIFVRGTDAVGRRLFDLCQTAAVGLALRQPNGLSGDLLRRNFIAPFGFDDEQALLPYGARSFQGYRLLEEYFSLPDRFSFIQLQGIGSGLRNCSGAEVELLLLLDRHDPLLEAGLKTSHAQLFCTPIVNLFEHRADRIQLSDRSHEYQVLPDRTRPGDYEVHSIREVVGHGDNGAPAHPFQPFYACTARSAEANGAYFTVHRRPRTASSQERTAGVRSRYAGSETFLALVDGSEGPYRSSLRQLGVKTLCTNRDLPLSLIAQGSPPRFDLDLASPVGSVRCIGGPSAPRPSKAWGGTCWRLVSQLSSNYLSLVGQSGENAAPALRELLQLYADLSSPATLKQIEGLRSVTSSAIVRRLPLGGPASFGRGLEVRVECDELGFEGTSLVGFGLVLEHFFARYASINSFTELVLCGSRQGEVARFPARLGRRRAL